MPEHLTAIGGTTGTGKGSAQWKDAGLHVVGLDGIVADATNPRVDLLTTNVEAGRVRINCIAGTPTPGADLQNLLGAPCLPAGHDAIAHVLVPQCSARQTHVVGFRAVLLESL